jgi:hypothetical protein
MRFLPLLLAIAILPVLAGAQDDSSNDDTIHAITALHEDGTKTVTITDPDKHSSEASTYDAGGRLTQKIVYALDDSQQIVSAVVYNSDNRPLYKSTYKRDDMNRISEEDDTSMDDQPIGRFVYEFGPNGKVIRIRAYDAQGNEIQQSEARKDERQAPPRVH